MTKLKEGYKETEVGVIPGDWHVKSFRDVSRVNQGLQIAISKRFKEKTADRLPYITIQYINSPDDKNNQYFIEGASNSVICYPNDILMTRTGNTGIVVTNQHGVFHNNFFKVDFNREIFVKDYLVYYLTSIKKLILSYAGTSTIPDLNHGDFYKLPVVIPPFDEQQRIVEILSTADIHIEKLDKTIEDYQLLKKGMIKKLLTEGIGHTEFKDTEVGRIPKEWEVVELIDIADKNSENSFIDGDWIEAEYITDSGIRLIQTGNIGIGNFVEKESKEYINETSFIALNCKEVRTGDILICRMAEPTGRSCVVPDLKVKMITSVDCVILRIDNQKYNNDFINYFLNSEYNLKMCKLNEQGTTRKRITRKKLESFKIPVPSLSEQHLISSMLLSVDNRIDLYQQEKEDFIQLKKALMEQLLTGKIRVNQ